ncbi:MAG TPA: tetratricopeptide repeat protein [Thermoanaerobaculia bacterium]|nr:tetratricopeptide repeat protein [Thermoanaerobaculia bacterium]
MRHYSRDELLAYLDRNDAMVDLTAVETHLAGCEACAERLREVDLDYAALSDWTVWANDDGAPVDPKRVSAFVSLYEAKLVDEAAAAALFAELTIRPLETWLEHLMVRPDGCTVAMVACLIGEARGQEEARPRDALSILDVAESLAAHDIAGPGKRETLFDLWRARATAFMVLGDYPVALAALDTAEAMVEGPAEGFDRAFLTWGRANVYFQMGRYAEALPLIEAANRVYQQFGDELRELQTRIALGSIYFEQGDIERAMATFESLLDPLCQAGEDTSIARVLSNVACCYLAAGDPPKAETHAAKALRFFDRLGLDTEKIRTRWALGRVHLRRGDTEQGVSDLRVVAADFRSRGLEVDAASVELDIVEACIDQGAYARAATIAANLATTFARAEARLDVVKALAHLRDAAEKMNATRDLVRTVKHLLAHPDQAFTLPDAER